MVHAGRCSILTADVPTGPDDGEATAMVKTPAISARGDTGASPAPNLPIAVGGAKEAINGCLCTLLSAAPAVASPAGHHPIRPGFNRCRWS